MQNSNVGAKLLLRNSDARRSLPTNDILGLKVKSLYNYAYNSPKWSKLLNNRLYRSIFIHKDVILSNMLKILWIYLSLINEIDNKR